MQCFSHQQELVRGNGARKREIFEQIFTRGQTILLIAPFFSGDLASSLLSKAVRRGSVWCIYHQDVLDEPMINVLSEIPSRQRVNLGSSWLKCFHAKICIVDGRYVYLGSSNFVDESFITLPSLKGRLFQFCSHSSELDIWMDAPAFATQLQTLLTKHFHFSIPSIQYSCISFSSLHIVEEEKKGRNFKCYFSFGESLFANICGDCNKFGELKHDSYYSILLLQAIPLNQRVNPITKRIYELSCAAEEIVLSGKVYCPTSTLHNLFIKQSLEGKKISLYTSFTVKECISKSRNEGGSVSSRIGGRICNTMLSQQKNNIRLYVHKDKGVMWHQKYYLFRFKDGSTVSLIGSYNLSPRSHLDDVEIMLEYSNLPYSPENEADQFNEVKPSSRFYSSLIDNLIARFLF